MIARVKEIVLNEYVLENIEDNSEFKASLRGNIKRKNGILVGDLVEVEVSYDRYMIKKILPRKNSLIRPPVANIDNLVIVVSLSTPSPDFFLLDKQIVLAKFKDILPIIVINKIDLNISDITNKDLSYIKNVYGNLGFQIIEVSAKNNIGIDVLKEKLHNKISAFSGNSGVGKSSIINKIFGTNSLTFEVAKKTNRGRHTTKHVKIYKNEDMYVLDTPGFSSYELYDIEYKELKNYYPDFLECKCDYLDCSHVFENEKVCGVKKAINDGRIDKNRYDRYVELFKKLKDEYDRKYK
ncbi:MAG: ribosome small subunit-dependent GTPase A [Clostridia bacterium]|nr:ribosome small subunit-dependent GTPase A [Clostridia bacterium]